MNFKPILFSTAMVEAIIAGRKMQTRRIVKPQPAAETDISYMPNEPLNRTGEWFPYKWDTEEGETICKHPKYNVGDILWVRETWRLTTWLHPSDEHYGYVFKASESGREWESCDESWIWKPSIFMPKQVCRLFLEVTDVRAERLQDISEEDAVAEGIEKNNQPFPGWYWMEGVYSTDCPINACHKLWEKKNGSGSWESNPFVWVITFKKVERPENFLQ